MKTCTFLLTTYNKIETLKEILNSYFLNRLEEYELIVSDGYSTDGTVEYLTNLHEKGLIDKLILSTEKDLGEWHGYKKALNLAEGKYIKFLTDDDFFEYSVINECLEYLASNDNIDWLISQGFNKQLDGSYHYSGYHEIIKSKNSTNPHINGLNEGMCGLGFFIKKSVATKLNILNNNFGARTDKQISLEITNSNLCGASTNLMTWVRILNLKSNTYLYNSSLENQDIKLVDKNFKINTENFSQELLNCAEFIQIKNKTLIKEFLKF